MELHIDMKTGIKASLITPVPLDPVELVVAVNRHCKFWLVEAMETGTILQN